MEDDSKDFGAVSLLQGFRPALTRLILGSAALAAAAGLAPAQSGVLYSFRATGTDGNVPVAGLIFNSNGALFGTTSRHHSADHAASAANVLMMNPD